MVRGGSEPPRATFQTAHVLSTNEAGISQAD